MKYLRLPLFAPCVLWFLMLYSPREHVQAKLPFLLVSSLTKTIEYPGFMGKLNRLKDLLGTQKQDTSVRATEYDPEYGETKFKSDAELS